MKYTSLMNYLIIYFELVIYLYLFFLQNSKKKTYHHIKNKKIKKKNIIKNH